MSILTFNFYVNEIICDKIYEGVDTIPESGIIFKRAACHNPTFLSQLGDQVSKTQPELVAITTQGESGYLHHDFLPNYMYYLNPSYNLLSHKKYKGINMSIYTRNDVNYKLGDSSYGSPESDSMAQYVHSNYGQFALIGLDHDENNTLIKNQVDQLIMKTLTEYKKSNVNYYFLMAHVAEDNGIGMGIEEYEYHNITILDILNARFDVVETSKNLIEYDRKNHVGIMNSYELINKTAKILCFSWNTDKMPLCDQNYGNDMEEHQRKRFWSDKCYNPLFFDQIEQEIKFYQPEIVAISNEGDLESGTFFHYQYLRTHMKKLKYYLLDNSKANNIGFEKETLRLSIYVRDDLDLSLVHANKSLFSYNEEYTCRKQVPTKNKIETSKSKAIVKYVDTDIGIIAFMAVQIPHEYHQIQTNQCLTNMQSELLNNKVSYVFMLGEFNSSIKQLDGPMSAYDEGPLVANYKLLKIKPNERSNFKLTNNSYVEEGWHNRIYFKTNELTSHDLTCLKYNTIMGFPMLHDGHHLGVLGVYEFQKAGIKPTSFNKSHISNEFYNLNEGEEEYDFEKII